ncbi:histidine-type phosphatase [Ancylobacter sp. SL191]|uniref:histidine-type phosphatase n=1 Tax=Ancylobacter sp. SL191 TaxID=2995166 RepID=UPI00226EC4A6|nr:histidine-type phosphatase [Ancylobacter sp. SL191]WAC27159.1 hypothetical protein OU996_19520 [Ancylobacter sp. SL191]
MRLFAVLAAGFVYGAAVAGPLDPPGADWQLKGTVILSRHGMRAVTIAVRCGGVEKPGDCLDALGADRWPDPAVASGHLTDAGFARMRVMGDFYRRHYAQAGLFPLVECPPASRVAFISDGVERTLLSAGAVMDGMFPGCLLPNLQVRPKLYHGPACGYEAAQARAASIALAGVTPAELMRGELARPLGVLDTVLGPFRPEACVAHGVAAPCSLATLAANGDGFDGLHVAAQTSEQFIMQYGADLPGDGIGWGRLPAAAGKSLPAAIMEVNALHAASERIAFMPPYQAVKRGTPVLSPVLAALTELAAGQGPAFTYFSSHDTLMLALAGMLDLTWAPPGFHPYQLPPGGAFAFELWQPPTGALMLRLVYIVQSLDQLRSGATLDAQNPPSTTPVQIGACGADPAGLCPWSRFAALAQAASDPACLPAADDE